MQTQKAEREINNAQSSRFSHRIGSTVFSVGVHFKDGGKETLEQKMLRMMKSDLASGALCGNMALPQADVPCAARRCCLERGTL